MPRQWAQNPGQQVMQRADVRALQAAGVTGPGCLVRGPRARRGGVQGLAGRVGVAWVSPWSWMWSGSLSLYWLCGAAPSRSWRPGGLQRQSVTVGMVHGRCACLLGQLQVQAGCACRVSWGRLAVGAGVRALRSKHAGQFGQGVCPMWVMARHRSSHALALWAGWRSRLCGG